MEDARLEVAKCRLCPSSGGLGPVLRALETWVSWAAKWAIEVKD